MTKIEAEGDLKQKTIYLKEISDVFKMDGWKHLMEWFGGKVEECNRRLLTCKIEDIYEARAKVFAYEDLTKIESAVKELITENEKILKEGGTTNAG